MFDFSRAIAEPRGCGERESGVYAESGLSPHGSLIERFLFDPPIPVPKGLDLVNKPQIRQRPLPTGESERDPLTGEPIYDLFIHVGAEYYPYAPDYIEETRRLGASRRLNPNLDLARLTRHSRIVLAHPKAIPTNWDKLLPPEVCKKHRPRHDLVSYRLLSLDHSQDQERPGLCIFKLWELITKDVAQQIIERHDERPICLREIGSTIYHYTPCSEHVEAWQAGFILALPLTGFALIQRADGSVNEKAKKKMLAGLEKNQQRGVPFYESDH